MDPRVHRLVREAKTSLEKVRPGLFSDVIVRCLHWGVIIKTPTLFLLAEPVWTNGFTMWYRGKGNPNCWWIHYVGGKIDRPYFSSLVEHTQYLGYERRGKQKIWNWGKKGVENEFKFTATTT